MFSSPFNPLWREHMNKSFAALTLAIAGACAIAATPPDRSAAPLDPSLVSILPKVQTTNGVEYLNGGAGTESVDYMKSRGSEFALQIVFSGRGGEYGVAETVTVRSAGRELLSVPDAGPLLMFKLAPGTYTVEATFKGVVEKRSVSVGSGVAKLNWNTVRASD
jgi:hypothetical protein